MGAKICFFHQCNHRWLDSRLCQLVEKAGSEKTDRAVGEHATGLVTGGVGFRLTTFVYLTVLLGVVVRSLNK